jgi:putative transposase
VLAAQVEGARIGVIADCLNISEKTIERWRKNPDKVDGRKGAEKAVAHALTQEEKAQIMEVVNTQRFRDLPPSKNIPLLADDGIFLASESTVYRLLKTGVGILPISKHRYAACIIIFISTLTSSVERL